MCIMQLLYSLRECYLSDVTLLERKILSSGDFSSCELGRKRYLILSVRGSYRDVIHKNRCYVKTVL